MIYKLNDKYYIKLSGYLIEVIPFIKDGVLDFKTTENKIEITADLKYKSVNLDNVRDELKNGRNSEETDLKPKKLNERTHDKFKFNYKD